MPKHSDVQDYLKALLEYYDLAVEKEHYISPNERIDLYGYSRSHGKTIGIEITFSSDVRRDAERLARAGFDLAFIVVDNPAYEGNIEYHGRIVPIIHYNSFENELRRILRISPSFPKFGSFEEWKDKHPCYEISYAEGKLDKFIQTLESSGLDEFVEGAVNALVLLYIVKEVPSMYRDPVTYDIIRYGGKTKRPQYIAVLKPKILSILKNFDLVFESARGSGDLRKYFAYLTDKGKEIGKEAILNRIRTHSEDLNELINEFGKMSAIITAGTVDRIGKDELMKLEIGVEKDVFDLLCLHSERKVTESKVHGELISRGVKVELKYTSAKKIHPLLSLICYFLTYYDYNKSKFFFDRLESMGLAYEVPIYGSYGQFSHDEIRSTMEVAEYILDKAPIISPDTNHLWEFGSLATLLSVNKICDPKVARERFESYLRFYEIPVDVVKRVLDELNKSGLTSKYVEIPDSGPFLVLDEKGFEEAVKRGLLEVAMRVLK